MRERRVAPRHVGVSVSGEFLFDRFLDQDLRRIDEALERHGGGVELPDWWPLLSSGSSADRAELERLYDEGDADRKRSMLLAMRLAPAPSWEVVLRGLAERDPDLRAAARRALSRTDDPACRLALTEALGTEMEQAEREALLTTLRRLATPDPALQRAARIHGGVGVPSPVVDVERWTAAIEESREVPDGPGEAEPFVRDAVLHLEALAPRVDAAPDDRGLRLELSEALIAAARQRIAEGRDPSFMVIEAREHAQRAADLGTADGEVAAVRAECAFLLGEDATAVEQARVATRWLVHDATSRRAAGVLEALARSATQEIYRLESEDGEWSSELLRDAHAAFQALVQHPLGDPDQATAHIDLLSWLGLLGHRERAVMAALSRFPASAEVHARFRAYVIDVAGIDALDEAYASLDPPSGQEAAYAWYHGYANLIEAEDHVRGGRREPAVIAYSSSRTHFANSAGLEPSYAESAAHFGALSLAREARLALDAGEFEASAELMTFAIQRRPESIDWSDGLGRTPLDTLKTIERTLREKGEDIPYSRLQTALVQVAPEVWQRVFEEEG